METIAELMARKLPAPSLFHLFLSMTSNKYYTEIGVRNLIRSICRLRDLWFRLLVLNFIRAS